jgi:HK97 gp10 family phage protein
VSNDNNNYRSNVTNVKNALTACEMAAFKEIGKYLRTEVRKNITNNVGTRTYKKKNGTLATIRPGRLKRSIGFGIMKKFKYLQIGSKAFYAPMVELGTRHVSPKSFLEETVVENIDHIRLIAGRHIREIEQENIDIGLLGVGLIDSDEVQEMPE